MFRNIICLTVVLWVAGCESYHGIRPLYPTPGGSTISGVASLQPTFQWEGAANSGTYDFAIWDALYKHHIGSLYTPGAQIYFRKGLTGTSHCPDITLLPFRVYFWSVRLSSESSWSTCAGDLFTFSTPMTIKP